LGWQQPAKKLKWFFKVNGGIAGSARKYALNRGASRRKKSGLVDQTPQEAVQTAESYPVK
jgi:hypothetical protein